jgi:hypothetical protein
VPVKETDIWGKGRVRMRTLIKAKWIVANDGRGHTLLRDGLVV